jgi:hypothetical protein
MASSSTATGELDEITLDEPLLLPHDHTLLLRAVHAHAAAIVAALGPRVRAPGLTSRSVLRAIEALPGADDKTRHTAHQVIAFLGALHDAPLPSSYQAALDSLDRALAPAQSPMVIVQTLDSMKEARINERVPGFAVGITRALDLIEDALSTAGTMMSGMSVFGRRRPAAVCRACARGCVWGALTGSVARVDADIAAVTGGVAGTTLAAIKAVVEQP